MRLGKSSQNTNESRWFDFKTTFMVFQNSISSYLKVT